ncbi:MAG: STAS domain-containing protein [Acidimicrobiaceae bacterium]|nr:STAS domain-containing protein [Acidimicrobiaceae bacterium]MYI36185.1 STAS domain-containing protein [Acidimicrobiaceae bacterium]
MSVTIRRSEQPPWTVLSVGGDLDVVGAPDMRQAVVTAVAEGSRLLVLDLSELDFVDSFGLGAVVGALKRVRQRGGELALVCPSSRIRRVFEICDLDRILALHHSTDTLSELSVAGTDGATSTRRRP